MLGIKLRSVSEFESYIVLTQKNGDLVLALKVSLIWSLKEDNAYHPSSRQGYGIKELNVGIVVTCPYSVPGYYTA